MNAMKETKKNRDTWILAAMGLLVAPAIMFAASLTGDDLTVYSWGVFGSASLSSAAYNSVSVGGYNTIDFDESLAVGKSVHAYDANSVVIGMWNKDTGGNELFVIGKGTSSVKSNAFEVFDDGSVCIPVRQGDIDMGVFGN